MAKDKKKSKKGSKRNKGNTELADIIADVVADAVADIVRKNTKKIIKSLEKKTGNLINILAPVVLKITNGDARAEKEIANLEEQPPTEDKTENNKTEEGKPVVKSATKKSIAPS
ncbi:MAG: hypothetical protein M3142_11010 [Bacteroidota bacterium]|nr:hypothetical protein [Bacteroidota bacterium]